MEINDFANIIRRECRYGQYGVTNDQATLDILAEINIRRKRIWGRYDWGWALESLLFPVVPNQTTYLVQAASGNLIDRITDLIPQDQASIPPSWGPPLIEKERQDFFAWFAFTPPTNNAPNWGPIQTPGTPRWYVNLGLDPAGSGLWQIMISPPPSSAFNMHGYAKKILKTFLLQDMINNTPFDYFPDGIIEDVLLDGVKAGIFLVQGYDDKAAMWDKAFEEKLNRLCREQANAAKDNSGIVTPVPDSYRYRLRNRSKSGTGYF